MYQQPHTVAFELPDWLEAFAQDYTATTDPVQRMDFVIAASRKNVEENSGGPFAAAIFEIDSGKLVALGVNLVTTQGLSMLHAEMVAITLAQKKLGSYDLGNDAVTGHELMTSTEPCAMCFGAIPWSGVRRVITGAKDEDARDIGFDEGPKLNNWIAALNDRGIEVVADIGRGKASEVLQFYKGLNGHIYNSRES